MKLTLLALVAMVSSFNTMAASISPSMSAEQFCSDRESSNFVKELTDDSDNLMGFSNNGGLINGGVCWWHSRFQRNSLYLTIYNPQENKPTRKEAKKIIGQIRAGTDAVIIPGYSNFYEFSRDYKADIQSELEAWQKMDGIVKFNWVVGLSGSHTVSAEDLKEKMDRLYDYVKIKGNIAYQKLQIKGIVAHAWLVIDMVETDDGYILKVLDSNFPHSTQQYEWKPNQTSFYHRYYGKFTPYLERELELDNVKLAIMKTCQPEQYAAIKEKEKEERKKQEARKPKSGKN